MQKARALLRRWRKRLNLDPFWQIEVEPATGCLGSVRYDHHRCEALVKLAPDLGENLERVVVHELLELLLWELGVLYEDLLESHVREPGSREALRLSHAAARNRLIERLIPALLREE